MEQLETRLTPAAYLGGGMVNASGVSFFPFPDWHGEVNIAEGVQNGQRVIAIGAGVGGGPRLGLFDIHGVRIAPDRFVGDPNTREGLVPFVLQGDSNQGGVPYDLSQKGVRLLGNSNPPGTAWSDLRSQFSHVSPQLVNAILSVGGVINVLYNEPVTNDPLISDLAGVRVDKYGTDSTTRYDGITGLTLGPDIVLRLDQLQDHTLLHEIGHVVDNMVEHGASMQADWQGIWKATKWTSDYLKNNYDEAWAESFALILSGKPVQDQVAAYFYSKYGDLMGLTETIGNSGSITLEPTQHDEIRN